MIEDALGVLDLQTGEHLNVSRTTHYGAKLAMHKPNQAHSLEAC